MKRMVAVVAALFAILSPIVVLAIEHKGHAMGHKTTVAHEEVVDGIKATFSVQTMAEAMKAFNMTMPKGVKETHHISVTFKDVKSNGALTDGRVTIKVQNPDKSGQIKELTGMHGHFGADFDFSKKGKYGVMCKFQLKNGKTSQAKFWYTVK